MIRHCPFPKKLAAQTEKYGTENRRLVPPGSSYRTLENTFRQHSESDTKSRSPLKTGAKRRSGIAVALVSFVLYWLFPVPTLHAQSVDSLLDMAYHLDMSAPEIAMQSAIAAYEMGQKANDETVCTKALALYAWITMTGGDFEMSLNLYLNALDYCHPDSLYLKAEIYNGIGYIYTRLEHFFQAESYIRQSIRLYDSLSFPEGLTSAYNNYGLNYYHNGNYTKADSCFHVALGIARGLDNEKYVAAIINNIGMSAGNSREKIAMLEESISINTSLNNVWSLADNYNNLGRQYGYMEAFDEALVALEKAESYAWKVNAKNLLYENYALKSEVYAKQKNYPMAYACTQKQLEINKSIQSNRSLRKIENNFTYKKLVKLEQEYALQQKEKRMAIRQRNYIVAFIALFLCMAGFYLNQRFLRKKKEMEIMSQQMELEQSHRRIMELELKKQEETITGVSNRLQATTDKLAYTLMFVKYRNELLEKIREQIKKAYSSDIKDISIRLKKIMLFIKQNQIEMSEDELSIEIDRQNQDFCTRLEAGFPEVTGKGKELAMFLRMGFSVKEISMITGTAVKTLNMNRYRLRKHLGINPEDDLIEFLKKI